MENMQTQYKGIMHPKILLAVAIDFNGMEKTTTSAINCFAF